MNRTQSPAPRRRGPGAVILEFLGSMNLAITLLVAIAIAAVIGTVLQQNQPYNDYIIKFGPFWFEVFKALGLYDVYSAPWFLFLLGFLLVSTAVCVTRQTPALIRDMRHFRLDVQEKSLRGFRHKAEWRERGGMEESAARTATLLARDGYRVRRRDEDGAVTLAAMKGSMGRLGYLLSHVAIVVICLGGLIDGNLGLKLAEYTGRIVPEMRNLPVSQVPPESVLADDSHSFRGSVSIPEGSSADFVFLGLRNGYLVQKLPFTVALDDFRIEHYSTGMPKSFESDIVVMDESLDEPLRTTIAVNHPLVYKGYAIYQSSFADGGSRMELAAWSLDLPDAEPLAIDGRIGEQLKLNTPRGPRTVELTDFKPLNVFPNEDGADRKFRNYGPSVIFKVRDAGGQAREYVNYMAPFEMDGELFFLSGMRENPGDPYRYLHIPLDAKASVGRFMRFRARAMDSQRLETVIREQVGTIAEGSAPLSADQLVGSVGTLVRTFLEDGIDAIVAEAERSAPEDSDTALNVYVKLIQNTLAALYIDMLAEQGKLVEDGVTPEDQRFFEASMNALSLMGPYGSPFVLQLTNFEQVQASGLQITKSPGKDIVYLGCVMLMAGVFFMFYMHHRRLWVRLVPDEGGVRVLFAGAGHRDRSDFSTEFNALHARLEGSGGGVRN